MFVAASTGPGRFMVFVVLCPGAPEGSTGSGSGFIASQKTGPRLKVSSDRLGGPGIKLVTPGWLRFSSPEPKTPGELIGLDWSRRPCVRVSSRPHFQTGISLRPAGLSMIKFHLEHHWGGRLAALSFEPDRIRALVSMGTDSSHRVIITTSAFIFDWFFFILAGNEDNHKRSDGFEIRQDQTSDCGVSCH